MPNYENDLGSLLRRVRRFYGYTQNAVAKQLGISRTAYTYYETGKSLPNINTLKKLAEIFQLPPPPLYCPEKLLEDESFWVEFLSKGQK